SAWRDVQVTLDTLAPATWIYHARGVQGMSRRLRGVRMDLRGELVTLHDWTLAPRDSAG
ncbi:MAG: ABC-type transporter, periplasmic subunit, partial [Gemmatimonadetes bacterium]|nr:ABC-type transporter, periplasmic subunit [Gemmatimonadota bacterium]